MTLVTSTWSRRVPALALTVTVMWMRQAVRAVRVARWQCTVAPRIGTGERAARLVADLADHYEVSPGVIQRVLKRLQADGLVRVIPRWGTFRA